MEISKTYSSKHLEDHARQLFANLDRARREDAEREREAPPAHVEGKRPGFLHRGDGEDEPDDAEAPDDQRRDEAVHVEHRACQIACFGERVCRFEDFDGGSA